MDDFPQVDDVDMIELFKNGDFSNGSGRNTLFL
jgi:hypothetical protein